MSRRSTSFTSLAPFYDRDAARYGALRAPAAAAALRLLRRRHERGGRTRSRRCSNSRPPRRSASLRSSRTSSCTRSSSASCQARQGDCFSGSANLSHAALTGTRPAQRTVGERRSGCSDQRVTEHLSVERSPRQPRAARRDARRRRRPLVRSRRRAARATGAAERGAATQRRTRRGRRRRRDQASSSSTAGLEAQPLAASAKRRPARASRRRGARLDLRPDGSSSCRTASHSTSRRGSRAGLRSGRGVEIDRGASTRPTTTRRSAGCCVPCTSAASSTSTNTGAATRARRLANEERRKHEGSWDFLDDLLKEELRLDPRVEHYRRYTTSRVPEDDEVLGLLRLMLDRTPARARPSRRRCRAAGRRWRGPKHRNAVDARAAAPGAALQRTRTLVRRTQRPALPLDRPVRPSPELLDSARRTRRMLGAAATSAGTASFGCSRPYSAASCAASGREGICSCSMRKSASKRSPVSPQTRRCSPARLRMPLCASRETGGAWCSSSSRPSSPPSSLESWR